MLNSPKFRFLLRLSMAVLGIALLGLSMAAAPGMRAQAAPGARPVSQATAYPADNPTPRPTTGASSGYPAGAATATNPPAGPTPTQPAITATFTPRGTSLSATQTPTETVTLPPDVFRTEDSEMGGSLVTPPATEPPGPTLTAVFTATGQSTPTAGAVSAAKTSQGGFGIDWGLFWIGFAIPVIFGCGAVLYLLDRKPSLFR